MKIKNALTALAIVLPLAAATVAPASAEDKNQGVTTSTPSNATNATQTPKSEAAPTPNAKTPGEKSTMNPPPPSSSKMK
jgi:hypothetical protein